VGLLDPENESARISGSSILAIKARYSFEMLENLYAKTERNIQDVSLQHHFCSILKCRITRSNVEE
jgi:hypothetical protein